MTPLAVLVRMPVRPATVLSTFFSPSAIMMIPMIIGRCRYE